MSFIAIRPFPCSKYLCPGRTPSALLGSGAPKSIAGITLRMLCVTAKETTKGVACAPTPIAISIAAKRFTCTPGMRPVKQPAKTPSSIARRSSNAMYLFGLRTFICLDK